MGACSKLLAVAGAATVIGLGTGAVIHADEVETEPTPLEESEILQTFKVAILPPFVMEGKIIQDNLCSGKSKINFMNKYINNPFHNPIGLWASFCAREPRFQSLPYGVSLCLPIEIYVPCTL